MTIWRPPQSASAPPSAPGSRQWPSSRGSASAMADLRRYLRPDRLLVEGEADPRADGGDDPEAQHYLRLRPGQQLEVVMDGSHQQDAAAQQLEGGHLQSDRERLDHEDAARDDQQDLSLGHHGQRTDCSA